VIVFASIYSDKGSVGVIPVGKTGMGRESLPLAEITESAVGVVVYGPVQSQSDIAEKSVNDWNAATQDAKQNRAS
jgi:hypothetical protein